jgi:hypothetical protein
MANHGDLSPPADERYEQQVRASRRFRAHIFCRLIGSTPRDFPTGETNLSAAYARLKFSSSS